MRNADTYSKLVFELSGEGKRGYVLPSLDVDIEVKIPEGMARQGSALLPSISEPELVRHYTLLSQRNYGLDSGMYPLGSCTMKYNPKVNEDVAAMAGFSKIHPLQGQDSTQGALELLYSLQCMLCEITGMDKFSLHPAAGAHGEMCGLMMMKAYHEDRGDFSRNKVIVPDSSHGTNPASATSAGLEIISIKSAPDGTVDIDALKSVLSDNVAGLMLTNPNTLGLFEAQITTISRLVHDAGGLLYYDGANMNAIMGIAKPAHMGFDVLHLNLHKTFSTPHGGGGPGSGPIGVVKSLEKFLPSPVVEKTLDAFEFATPEKSIGKIRAFAGNFNVLVKAYCYILTMGAIGLKLASEIAVLNANYLKERLKGPYKLPYEGICMHEFVLDGLEQTAGGVKTLDVAKRLIDYGFHPPTVYFPLIVENAIMIEPTETESLAEIDAFADAMLAIAKEALSDPELLKGAPHTSPVGRVDELVALKKPVLKYNPD
ncbi:MAG: aminomethyl-transferring glycine dehydrogenase subunit GcvPB [Eubacteriaceae bacterium]|nr:aminomethyl-transferring glycine dehydrogenase subunit GcvPB [Eubacteriaceae bacterium]